MGGVRKYGYGHRGWERARSELDNAQKNVLYQKIGIVFLIAAFLGAAILIVTR